MTHMAPTPPPAPEPPKKKHRKWPWVLAVLAAIVIIGSVANSGNSTSKPAPKGTTAPVQVNAPPAAPAAPAVTTPLDTPSPAPSQVVAITGNGIKKTPNFTVTNDQWTIAYTYDCTAFGSQGNFIVNLYTPDGASADSVANEIGASGNSSTTEHGVGSYYLEVNSECSWTVTVTG